MYFTYVLFSNTLNKRYIGSTANIEKRLREHNAGKSQFTRGGIPWSLIYKESFVTLSAARRRESYLKSGQGRKLLDEILRDIIEDSEP